ncbi:hypothetical protein [Dermacoccus nishinomiyaensis]|uniref:hypothetical protein n=1 Tax=Dermacoccus nishinomiyaensis TaxID=1274 RepID=UPI00123715C0|nr:hypothetical protein [Dermacoccus nishinomiyaensis]
MMAHSNDVVTDLNARRPRRPPRAQRRTYRRGASALRSGLEASVGDTIVTRKNNRRLVMNATDFVKNGDRWTVTEVRDDGSLRVQHHAHTHLVTLPAEYVATQVDLGYASTFHGAQGQTVDEGLALLSGGEDRQLFYVGTTRRTPRQPCLRPRRWRRRRAQHHRARGAHPHPPSSKPSSRSSRVTAPSSPRRRCCETSMTRAP